MTDANLVVAGTFILAALLSALELAATLTKNPPWRASFFIFFRVGLDGAGGILILYLLRSVYGSAVWFTDVVQVLMSGILGPALLRSQIALPGPGKTVKELGLRPYRRLRDMLDIKIDTISAVSESRWIQCTVLPVLNELDLDYLVERIEYYIRNLDRLEQEQRDASITLIKELAAEGCDETVARRALLQNLLDNGGRSVVKSLCKETRRKR